MSDDDNGQTQHWFEAQPRATQKSIRLAFFALIVLLFAWGRHFFRAPVEGGIEADFSLLISGLVVSLSGLVGGGLALYQIFLLKQIRAGMLSLIIGLTPLVVLYLFLQYLTRVQGLVLI